MLNLDSLAQAVVSLAGVAGKAEDASVMAPLDDLLRRGLKAGVIRISNSPTSLPGNPSSVGWRTTSRQNAAMV